MAKDRRKSDFVEDGVPREATGKATEAPAELGAPFDPAEPGSVVNYRRCPLCFGGNGGIGKCYSSHYGQRYYRCDKCGHTWTVLIEPAKVVAVVHRDVELETRTEDQETP